jgi:hypothetical protein
MTILRDVVDGGLMVQMGERVFRSVSGNDAVKANFMKVMRELATVVKTGSLESAQPSPVVETDSDESYHPQPSEPEEPASLRDLVSPPLDSIVSSNPAARPAPANNLPMPGDLPKYKLDPLPAKKPGGLLRRGKLELEPVPELDIAGAIETYLQHKLQFTQQHAGRSIHVHPAPGGGVSIEVDGRFYEAVGDVDDPQIRQFLQETIQEWQQRH